MLRDLLRRDLLFSLRKQSVRTQQSILRRQKLKEKRRLKLTNTYAQEYTGEEPLHSWLDMKKIRQIVSMFQINENKHSMSTKIDEQDRKLIAQKSIEQNELDYIKMLQMKYQKEKMQENIDDVSKQINLLPLYLRTELQNKKTEKDPNFIDTNLFYNHYYEQILRLYPDDEVQRMRLQYRLDKIIKNTLTTVEE